MSSRICNQCGCTDIDIDSARGDAVCTGCGSVLEDQIIVSEVQFQENSGGGSSLIGQFVSSEGPGKSFSIGGSFPHGMQKESRTVTLQNGKKRIQQLASQMNLNQHCVDTAFNFFKMAVSKRMTRGRKTTHVVAACLYLVCRTERTSHMLLDFSDALQVNVYSLGRTYLQLSRELCINLPDVDPCLYISRFAHALQFDDKTHEVSMTAMRLVQRMKRDWMSTGRRPSGLCGAALLVAARIHDFSRSVKEIIKVVKVCSSTLRKRLIEFEETPSSQLTIEEFQTIDLEEEQDPPCFTEGKRRAKKQLQLQEQSKLPEYTSQVSQLQEEIEETLRNQKPRGIWAAYAKVSDDTCSVDSDTSRLSDLQDAETSVDSGKNTSIESSPSIPNDSIDNNSSNSISETQTLCETDNTGPVDTDAIANELVIGAEVNVSNPQTDQTTPTAFVPPPVASLGLAAADSLGLGVSEIMSDRIKEGSETSRDSINNEGDELDLTGIDDTEISKFLLSEREVLVKTKIWMAENADYLEEQRLKEEKRAREAEEEAKKPPEKRKRQVKRKKKQPVQEAATAQEAIQKIMQEKKISCKINYDVLNDLNVKSAIPKTPDVFMPGSILKDMKQPMSRLGKSSVSFDLRSEGPPASKKRKADIVPMLPIFTKQEVKPQPDIVVESEPVQYEQKDDGYCEEEEDGDYDDDEVQHLSAAQLLGHTGPVEEEYDYDMD